MRNSSKITLAALLATIALAAPAIAGDMSSRAGVGVLKSQGGGTPASSSANGGVWKTTDGGASMPTDQRAQAVQEAYGDALGRKAGRGELQVFTGGVTQGEVPMDQMPVNQRAGAVKEIYGALLGRDTGGSAGELLPAVKLTTLGSLNTVGSLDNLFANSRGGDQHGHGVGGGGGAGKVSMRDFTFVPAATTKATDFPASTRVAGGAGTGEPTAANNLKQLGIATFQVGTNARPGAATGPSVLAAQNQVPVGAHVKAFDGNTGNAATGGGGPHVKTFKGTDATGAGSPRVAAGATTRLSLATTARK